MPSEGVTLWGLSNCDSYYRGLINDAVVVDV